METTAVAWAFWGLVYRPSKMMAITIWRCGIYPSLQMRFWLLGCSSSSETLDSLRPINSTKQGVGFALGSSGPISDYLTILYSAHLLSSWVVFCPSRQPSQPDCVAPTALSTEKCHAPLLSPFPPRHLTSDQIHVSPMYLPTAHGCIPVGLHSKCPQNDLIFLLCYLLAADIS